MLNLIRHSHLFTCTLFSVFEIYFTLIFLHFMYGFTFLVLSVSFLFCFLILLDISFLCSSHYFFNLFRSSLNFSSIFHSFSNFYSHFLCISGVTYEDEVSRCLKMPAEYNTVVIRAKLAQKMYDSATKEIKECERHVFDQHLQQQGWAAVMANLEDLTNEFKQRSQMILDTINDYLEKRPKYLDYLNAFPADLEELATVPILSELLPSAQHDFHGFDEFFNDNVSYTGSTSADSGTSVGGSSSNSRNRESLSGCDSGGVGDSSSQTQGDTVISTGKTSAAAATTVTQDKASVDSHETPKNRTLTLLQWISSKENHKALDDIARSCSKVLTRFDENSIQAVKDAIKRTINIAEQVCSSSV